MLVSVITLGCKVNEYESQSILNQLKMEGYDICEGLKKADAYIINTCAVTNMAERKSRQVLAKIFKLNPEAKIAVCGCAVQNNPTQFLKNKNVIAIVGNEGKNAIIKFIKQKNKELLELNNEKYNNTARPIMTRTRQYIKIQDGCNYFCTYCIIPYLRGRSRSRDIDDILDEIRQTSANEIVLTGINISDYRIGNELGLKRLIKEIDKLNIRFRISSLECNVLDDEMIEILKNSKNFCPHFHISLQSACNETLKRMNRRYTIEEYINIVKKIRSNFNNPSISTDIIVGFKGETEEEFNQTVENLKIIQFSFMHIFPYSERSGTNATKLSGAIDRCEQKRREHVLQEMNKEFKHNFYNQNKNTVHKVLIEEVIDENLSLGYTDNYIYTYIDAKCKVGDIVDAKLISEYENGMKAQSKYREEIMEDCIFCKIKKGELPSTTLYSDDEFMIIKDINPQAKIHLIAIPNEHVPYIDMMTEEGAIKLGKMISKISHLQEELGLTGGYRLVINQGDNAGQTVAHVHIHILGGEKLKEL